MMVIFIAAYVVTIIATIMALVMNRKNVSFFSPWPGFVVIFSTYFLFGTLALTSPVTDMQWLLYALCCAGFTAGCLFVYLYNGSRFSAPKKRFQKQACIDHFYYSLNINLLIGLALISTIVTLYMWSRTGAPLLSDNVDAARAAYLSNGYIATVGAVLDVCAVVSFAYICSSKGKKKSWPILAAILICAVFVVVAILAGSRTRLLKFVIPCVFIYNYFRRPIKTYEFAVAGILGVLFIGAIGYYRGLGLYGGDLAEGIGSDAGNWSAFDFVIFFARKELSTAAYGLDLVIRYMPSTTEHTNGLLHVGPFLSPFQIKVPIPGDFFKEMVGGKWYGFGLAATFISPMYADFSWPGVLCLSFVYAVFISLSYFRTKDGALSSGYWIPIYGMLFFFMVSGIRSDMVSFELLWFIVVGYAFKVFQRPVRLFRHSEGSVL